MKQEKAMPSPEENLDILNDLVNRATRLGADAADALMLGDTSIGLARRLGNQEQLERSEGRDLGLRVLIGKRQAIVSSSDCSAKVLKDLAERAVSMAGAVPEDPHCGLADPDLLQRDPPEIDSCDPVEPTPEQMTEMGARAEAAARAVPGVTNSEGAEVGWGRTDVAIVGSNGFSATYARTGQSLSVSVLAGKGADMERDYDHTAAVFGEDMEDPEAIGRSAGEKAVKRLNPRKVETARVPIVYDPRVSRGIVGHLSSAVNGDAIARGASFLTGRMNEVIFSDAVTIVDDPHRKRGFRSRPFDGEGVKTTRRDVIDQGRLTTWFLDLRSARQLGLKTTGHAARGVSSPPSPSASNLYMQAGKQSPKELMADIKSGFYVTELIGFGVNGVTGDYSRGATGFWIENGDISFPVSEVTIAGNLGDMFKQLTPADDLTFRHGVDAPTIRIDGMTVAGK